MHLWYALQGEVSKYSLKLSKINLDNANKTKIYNIKSNHWVFGIN